MAAQRSKVDVPPAKKIPCCYLREELNMRRAEKKDDAVVSSTLTRLKESSRRSTHEIYRATHKE